MSGFLQNIRAFIRQKIAACEDRTEADKMSLYANDIKCLDSPKLKTKKWSSLYNELMPKPLFTTFDKKITLKDLSGVTYSSSYRNLSSLKKKLEPVKMFSQKEITFENTRNDSRNADRNQVRPSLDFIIKRRESMKAIATPILNNISLNKSMTEQIPRTNSTNGIEQKGSIFMQVETKKKICYSA